MHNPHDLALYIETLARNMVKADDLTNFRSIVNSAKLPNDAFKYANFKNIDFSQQDLSGLDFSEANFENCIFDNATINGSTFKSDPGLAKALMSAADYSLYLLNSNKKSISHLHLFPNTNSPNLRNKYKFGKRHVCGATQLPSLGSYFIWSSRGEIIQFDDRGKLLRKFRNHYNKVNGILALPNGHDFVSWSDDGTLKIHNLISDSIKTLNQEYSVEVIGAKFVDEDSRILSWNKYGKAHVWSNDGFLISTFEKNEFITGAVDTSKHGVYVIFGRNGMLNIWNTANNRKIEIPGHKGWVTEVRAISEELFVSFCNGGIFCIWSIDGRIHRTIKPSSRGFYKAIFLTENRSAVALCVSSDSTWRCNFDDRTTSEFSNQLYDLSGGIYCAEQKCVIFWTDEGEIKITNLDGSIRRSIKAHRNENREYDIFGVKTILDGSYLLSWGSDYFVRVWDFNGNLQSNLGVDFFYDMKIELADNGKSILVFGQDEGCSLISLV